MSSYPLFSTLVLKNSLNNNIQIILPAIILYIAIDISSFDSTPYFIVFHASVHMFPSIYHFPYISIWFTLSKLFSSYLYSSIQSITFNSLLSLSVLMSTSLHLSNISSSQHTPYAHQTPPICSNRHSVQVGKHMWIRSHNSYYGTNQSVLSQTKRSV